MTTRMKLAVKWIQDGLDFRLPLLLALPRLKLRRLLAGKDIVVQYSWARLPYSGDGDLQEVIYHAHFEKWHDKTLREFGPYVKAGDTVLDVGANLGFLALIFGDLVGPEGRVLAFEPSRQTFQKLERTVEVNHRANITALNFGCGEAPAKVKLFHSRASGNSSILGSTAQHKRQDYEEIEIIRLDDVVPRHVAKVSFLKVDTEGYEPTVLKGALQIIQRDRPLICVELSSEFRDSAMQAVSLLKSWRYRIKDEPDFSAGHVFGDFVAVPG